MTSYPGHLTPLERWKRLAEAENAAMQAGHREHRRAAPDPDEAAKADTPRPAARHSYALSREVFRLYHEERCAFSEIAARLSLPPRQVGTLLRQGRRAAQDTPYSATPYSGCT